MTQTTAISTRTRAGAVAPRRASYVCRVLIVITVFASLIGGAAIAQATAGSDGNANRAAEVLVVAAGLILALGWWIMAVLLDWAAAMFEELADDGV